MVCKNIHARDPDAGGFRKVKWEVDKMRTIYIPCGHISSSNDHFTEEYRLLRIYVTDISENEFR